MECARTLVELGAALRRTSQRIAARDPLRRGLEFARRCGADRREARAREELRMSGARPRRAAVTGPESLTASEARAAHLAADGMSNREIAQYLATTKTVENQLDVRVAQLGVRSREDLRHVLEANSETVAR